MGPHFLFYQSHGLLAFKQGDATASRGDQAEDEKVRQLVEQGLRSLVQHLKSNANLSTAEAEQKVMTCFRERVDRGNGLFDALFQTHDELAGQYSAIEPARPKALM